MIRPLSAAVLALLLASGCPEAPKDTSTPSDSDTDTDTDTDTDSDTDTDTDSDADADTDSDTDNDSIATADPIVLDADGEAAMAEVIEQPGDRDFFAFDALAGHTYVIDAVATVKGRPDTVVRVYDPDAQMVLENDDLPYRLGDTDGGMELATDRDGVWTIEVLEWGDWAGYTPSGGADFGYTLRLWDHDAWDGNTEPYGDEDAPAAAALYNDEDQDGYYPFAFDAVDFPDADLFEARGRIATAGDEDWLWMAVAPNYGAVLQFSLWDGLTTLQPVLELWYEDCDPYGFDCAGLDIVRLATTTDAAYSPLYTVYYDAGISYPMARPGLYYLRIADRTGAGGPEAWYSVMLSDDPLPVMDAEDGLDLPGVGLSVPPIESTSTPGYLFNRVGGALDGGPLGGGEDASDTFVFDWAASGKTLDVQLDTTGQGSLLDDAELVLWHEDAPDSWSILAGPAAALSGLLLADDARLALTIRSASGEAGPERYYLGLITAAP